MLEEWVMHTRQKKRNTMTYPNWMANYFWYAKQKQVSPRINGIDEQSRFFIIHFQLLRCSCFILCTKLICLVVYTKSTSKRVFCSFFSFFLIFCLLFLFFVLLPEHGLFAPSVLSKAWILLQKCDTWSIFVLLIKLYLLSFIHAWPMHTFSSHELLNRNKIAKKMFQ